jgi:hypothetical protein
MKQERRRPLFPTPERERITSEHDSTTSHSPDLNDSQEHEDFFPSLEEK